MQSPWGRKAFTGYLGDNEETWKMYDATELIKSGVHRYDQILIEQGSADQFLAERLLTNNLVQASNSSQQKLNVRYQENYDHSYYFIASFIENHIQFHARHL